MEILDSFEKYLNNKKQKELKKFYICDRTMCIKCNPECRHTSIAARARYKSVPGSDNLIAYTKNKEKVFDRTFKKVGDGLFELDPVTGKL